MQPTEKELEIALQYGVTSPQVSQNLNWKSKTYFYWVQTFKGFELKAEHRNTHFISPVFGSIVEKEVCKDYYSASTLHELAKATAELLDVPITHVWSLYAEKGVQTADDAAKVYLEIR